MLPQSSYMTSKCVLFILCIETHNAEEASTQREEEYYESAGNGKAQNSPRDRGRRGHWQQSDRASGYSAGMGHYRCITPGW
ncbi:hypothetical protein D3C86_1807840 [compost metagenome]